MTAFERARGSEPRPCPDACVEELALAESESYSSTISRSSIARSFIDCTRWSGLLARQRRMRRRSSAGTLALSSSTGTGFSLRILCIVSMPVSAAKGFLRVAASYRMQPNEKMSERWSTALPWICSGDM